MLSGRIATELPAACRSAISTLGSLLVAFALCPTYLSNPMLLHDPLLSVMLGLVGICLPVFLIALSSPKLPAGLTTIMASSELPSGVLCAMLFLGDPISTPVAAGVILVLLGIVLSETDNLRKAFARPAKLDKRE
jgi:drug/metabolite transporter (DMT)-like permease